MMRDLTEYESELVLDALAGFIRTMEASAHRTDPTEGDARTLRAELVADHRARFRDGEPPTIHVCTTCGVTVQTLGALGWASTSTGGLQCGFPRRPHVPAERCGSTSREGTRCELTMEPGAHQWSGELPDAAHRGTNGEGRRVQWRPGNGQGEEPVPATCESCGAEQATMWDQSCMGSTTGRHTWRHEGEAPSRLRADEEAAVTRLIERLDDMRRARLDRPPVPAEADDPERVGGYVDHAYVQHPDDNPDRDACRATVGSVDCGYPRDQHREVVDAVIYCGDTDLISSLAGLDQSCTKPDGHEPPHLGPDGATWGPTADGGTEWHPGPNGPPVWQGATRPFRSGGIVGPLQ